MATRRGFLASVLLTASLPQLTWADAGAPAYLGAAKEPDGSFALFGLSAAGEDRFRLPLPARGHAGAAHSMRPEAVIFARRPGTFARVLDCVTGQVMHDLAAPQGAHFSGHGTYSGNGALLFTGEVNNASGQGQIGIWNVDEGYARQGSFASGGIGPHEIMFSVRNNLLVVANGGIQAALDDERTTLNLETMQPNLTYLSQGGEVVDQLLLPAELRLNSIRHLAQAADGTVAFAMQWQGEAGVVTPLLGLHRPGQSPVLAEMPDMLALRLKGYAGSVAFSGDGARVAISCPRGGLLVVFDRDGTLQTTHSRADICGLGSAPDGFFATDGLGGIARVQNGALHMLNAAPRAWDNHLITL